MVDIPISGPARLDGQVALVTGAAGGTGTTLDVNGGMLMDYGYG